MKIVKKRLKNGTIKIYEYPHYIGGRRARLERQCVNEAKFVLAAHGLPAGPPILIYFIQSASGPIKIGITTHVARRLEGVARTAFEDVRLLATFPGSRNLEKQLHNSLARYRMKNDWFMPHEHVLRAISDLQNKPWQHTVRNRPETRGGPPSQAFDEKRIFNGIPT